MKCDECGFELPGDWPEPAGDKVLCVPCLRRAMGGGTDRGGVMTP
jgi:hypothetical protein